jgi:hypothetical protein
VHGKDDGGVTALNQWTRRTLAFLVALIMVLILAPQAGLGEAQGQETVDDKALSLKISAWTLLSYNPAASAKLQALPEGNGKPIRYVSLRRYAEMKQGEMKTLQITVAPATRSALQDLMIMADLTKLYFAKADLKVSGNRMVLSFTFYGADLGIGRVVLRSQQKKNLIYHLYVKVKPQPVKSVTLYKTSASLGVGQKLQLAASVLPTSASYPKLRWTSSDKHVAAVSSSGVVTAKKAGKATIYATTSNGKRASCKVTVAGTYTAKKYRALLVGIKTNAIDADRYGVNFVDTAVMQGMLNASTIDGKSYAVHIPSYQNPSGINPTMVLEAISQMAQDTGYGENDVTLVYFSCDGGIDTASSEPALYLPDSTKPLTLSQLRAALDQLPGKVVVILDTSCSGGFIGKGTASKAGPAAFNRAALGAFELQGKGLDAPGYDVIAACSSTENSMANYDQTNNIVGSLMTVLLTNGAGYSYVYGAQNLVVADSDKSNTTTALELYNHTKDYIDRVTNVPGTGILQNMQGYFSDPGLPVVGRN